ncbi:hypothetical protein [Amycolatopsis anabasis]|uniref:hypothetical protein n=1 Tax=Amycolatopsis anabasis TaxID=1840409 RepID=UPI001FE8EE90|nr:hypothetical protein [Amycolatopsis anabasis]
MRVAFNAQWKPGPEAQAGMHTVRPPGAPELVALVVYADPDSLALVPPADPAKWPEFIRLLHEIQSGAGDLAAFLQTQLEEMSEQ